MTLRGGGWHLCLLRREEIADERLKWVRHDAACAATGLRRELWHLPRCWRLWCQSELAPNEVTLVELGRGRLWLRRGPHRPKLGLKRLQQPWDGAEVAGGAAKSRTLKPGADPREGTSRAEKRTKELLRGLLLLGGARRRLADLGTGRSGSGHARHLRWRDLSRLGGRRRRRG